MLPVQLKTDGDTDTVFAGFATNLPFLGNPNSQGVEPITDLSKDENLAIAFQPDMINNALSLLMFGGDVSRRYSLSGRADATGPAHVVTNGFQVGPRARPPDFSSVGSDMSDAGDAFTSQMTADTGTGGDAPSAGGLPLSLGFDVFNLRTEDNVCFSFGAAAYGSLTVQDNNIGVQLDDIQFTNATLQRNLVNLAGWSDAEFVTRSKNLVSQSVDTQNIRVPGAQLSLGNIGLETRERAVVVRASSTASEAESE